MIDVLKKDVKITRKYNFIFLVELVVWIYVGVTMKRSFEFSQSFDHSKCFESNLLEFIYKLP